MTASGPLFEIFEAFASDLGAPVADQPIPVLDSITPDEFSVFMNYNTATSSTASGYLAVYWDTGGGDGAAVSANIGWNDDAWHLIGITYDVSDDLIRIFCDGAEVASASPGGTPPTIGSQTYEWFGLSSSTMQGVSLAHYLFGTTAWPEAEWATLQASAA